MTLDNDLVRLALIALNALLNLATLVYVHHVHADVHKP